jgi:hypothetical protein
VFVINSHNFDTGFNPSVNGKSPIAVWCPSQDTAGNGTTTLTDLVGSNDGTLTNMDPATDWVLDDGKYALDFDGVNDYVAASALTPDLVSVCAWIKRDGSTGTIAAQINSTGSFWGAYNLQLASGKVRFLAQIPLTGFAFDCFSASTIVSGDWVHVTATFDGAAAKVYINGVEDGSAVSSTPTLQYSANQRSFGIGAQQRGDNGAWIALLDIALDDIRIFDQPLDATDAAALYAAGRGGNA